VLTGLTEVTAEVVHQVAERMVGVPVDLGSEMSERLATVREHLIARAFCPERAADQVVRRLEVTMRGLDVDPSSPNVVLLVADTSGDVPELTARVLAESLYGDRRRLIEVDMTRFTHAADVNWLTGAPPGYVGHDRALGFHLELAQQPWSVVLFKNVEASHPQAQELMAQAFRAGYFTDNRGQRVYLSDAALVLTVTADEKAARAIGFGSGEDDVAEEQAGPQVSSLLVSDLVNELDAWWAPAPPTAENVRLWVAEWVLPPLTERYAHQGMRIDWHPSILRWLTDAILDAGNLLQGERLLEEKVLPILVEHLEEARHVVLSCDEDGDVRVEPKGA
jgi:ATP-dependent Clp protease ATP-binding subunit ClpC